MRQHRRSMIAIGALALVGFAGCSDDGQASPSSKIVTYEQALQEYRDATKELELAPDATWAENPNGLVGTDEQGNVQGYETGVGSQQAELQWYCSWAQQALSTTGADQQQAIDTLAGFEDLGVWKKMDDNGHTLFSTMLADARLGNLASLTSYVGGSCT